MVLAALLGILAVGIICFLIGLAWGQQMQDYDTVAPDTFTSINTPPVVKSELLMRPLNQRFNQPPALPETLDWVGHHQPILRPDRQLIEQELDRLLSNYQKGKLSEDDYLSRADALIDELADVIRIA